MKLGITGITGFVGRHLLAKLFNDKFEMNCLVLKNDKYINKIEKKKNLHFYEGDILNIDDLKKTFKGCEVIIHLAGLVANENYDLNYKINFVGTKNCVDVCKQLNIKRFIYLSAVAAIYKNKTNYGKTKALAEEYIVNSKLDYTILRPPLIYGQGSIEFEKFLSSITKIPFIIPILGSGLVHKQPIFIECVNNAILNTINNPRTVRKIYDIASEERITLLDFINLICKIKKIKKIKIHIPQNMVLFLVKISEKLLKNKSPISTEIIKGMNEEAIQDITGAENDLNFRPIPIEEGLKKYFSLLNK